MDPLVAKLSPGLFWDVNRETIDSHTHRALIVERALEYGTFDDWLTLRRTFSDGEIAASCRESRGLMPETAAFVEARLHLPEGSLPCMKPW